MTKSRRSCNFVVVAVPFLDLTFSILHSSPDIDSQILIPHELSIAHFDSKTWKLQGLSSWYYAQLLLEVEWWSKNSCEVTTLFLPICLSFSYHLSGNTALFVLTSRGTIPLLTILSSQSWVVDITQIRILSKHLHSIDKSGEINNAAQC